MCHILWQETGRLFFFLFVCFCKREKQVVIFSRFGPGNRIKISGELVGNAGCMGIFPGGRRREMGEHCEITVLGVPQGNMRKSAIGQIPSTGFRPWLWRGASWRSFSCGNERGCQISRALQRRARAVRCAQSGEKDKEVMFTHT